MPVYEYECESCGTRFERFQSIHDEPVRQCPECSGLVRKIYHPAGIIFKGSGWYITDSRQAASGAVTGEGKQNSGSNGDKKGSEQKASEPKAPEQKAEKAESPKQAEKVESK